MKCLTGFNSTPLFEDQERRRWLKPNNFIQLLSRWHLLSNNVHMYFSLRFEQSNSPYHITWKYELKTFEYSLVSWRGASLQLANHLCQMATQDLCCRHWQISRGADLREQILATLVYVLKIQSPAVSILQTFQTFVYPFQPAPGWSK